VLTYFDGRCCGNTPLNFLIHSQSNTRITFGSSTEIHSQQNSVAAKKIECLLKFEGLANEKC